MAWGSERACGRVGSPDVGGRCPVGALRSDMSDFHQALGSSCCMDVAQMCEEGC